jgi:phenylpyruvate tautomerase PptA (4-oxalocrotonate tautomerase family)
MPYFSIQTNQTIEENARTELVQAASAFIGQLLGKPESYVMVAIQPDTPMSFGGDDAPTAMVLLKSIGLPRERCGELSQKICQFLEQRLDIRPERIFIDFKVVEGGLFGWNQKTF